MSQSCRSTIRCTLGRSSRRRRRRNKPARPRPLDSPRRGYPSHRTTTPRPRRDYRGRTIGTGCLDDNPRRSTACPPRATAKKTPASTSCRPRISRWAGPAARQPDLRHGRPRHSTRVLPPPRQSDASRRRKAGRRRPPERNESTRGRWLHGDRMSREATAAGDRYRPRSGFRCAACFRERSANRLPPLRQGDSAGRLAGKAP